MWGTWHDHAGGRCNGGAHEGCALALLRCAMKLLQTLLASCSKVEPPVGPALWSAVAQEQKYQAACCGGHKRNQRFRAEPFRPCSHAGVNRSSHSQGTVPRSRRRRQRYKDKRSVAGTTGKGQRGKRERRKHTVTAKVLRSQEPSASQRGTRMCQQVCTHEMGQRPPISAPCQLLMRVWSGSGLSTTPAYRFVEAAIVRLGPRASKYGPGDTRSRQSGSSATTCTMQEWAQNAEESILEICLLQCTP